MTPRDTILASIRRSLGVSGREAPRRKAVADRLREHPEGVVPARGKLAPKSRAELFRKMVEAAAGSIEEVPRAADVPRTVNWITGQSRSADIEQTLILGAHGPRRLHVMVVGETE